MCKPRRRRVLTLANAKHCLSILTVQVSNYNCHFMGNEPKTNNSENKVEMRNSFDLSLQSRCMHSHVSIQPIILDIYCF